MTGHTHLRFTLPRLLLAVLLAGILSGLLSCTGTEADSAETFSAQTETAAETEADEKPEEFTLNAQSFLEQMTMGINIGNTLDSYYTEVFGAGSTSNETLWGNPYIQPKLFEAIRDMGFTTVRIPVTWYPHMDPETHLVRDYWMKRVKKVVDDALDAGLTVIVNVHHDTSTKGWIRLNADGFEETKETFSVLWQQIADTFRDYGEALLFEGFNEACGDTEGADHTSPASSACLNTLNQLFVDTVRASGGNNGRRYLICSTYFTRSRPQIVESFILPQDTADDRLIVQTHIYTTQKTELYPQLDYLYEHFVRNGIPVLIGECGYKTDSPDFTPDWAHTFLARVRTLGMRAILWDTGNSSNYQYLNRTARSFRQPELLAALQEEWTKNAVCGMEPLPAYREVSENLMTAKWDGFAGTGSTAVLEKGKTLTVRVTEPGPLIWSTQAYIKLPVLEHGKTYRISLTYTNTSDMPIPVKIENFYGVLCAHTENAEETIVIPVCDGDISGLSLVLYCSAIGSAEPYTVAVSEISLCEVTEQ